MNSYDLSLFVAASIMLAAIIAGVMVVVGVTRLAHQPGVLSNGSGDVAGADRIARVDRWTALIVAIWVAGALLVTFVFGNRSSLAALLYVAALVGIGYGLTVFTETGRRLLKAVPQTWLIGAQTYRIVGGVFLIAATYDAVPAYFGYPGGLGRSSHRGCSAAGRGLVGPPCAIRAWQRRGRGISSGYLTSSWRSASEHRY